MTYAPLNEMNLDRDTTNDLVWDEESGTYINAYNPTVKELEANGVVYDIISKGVMNNNNETPLKMWSGTKAEYNAIETKDENTLYNITDDTFSISLLERIWPVGSIYIGTMNTCPLAALFGTWTLVAADRVLQGAGTRGSVGTTINEKLPNIKGDIAGQITPAVSSEITKVGVFSSSTIESSNKAAQGSNYRTVNRLIFDASNSSSTYQDNAPVQQDAYLVNIWERTAWVYI